jgi:ABC-2 type transport system permease protein
MRATLQRIFALSRKELLALLHDSASRAVLIGPPIIQLLVFGYAATFELKHVPFVVYNQDQGQSSRDLIARFVGAPSFDLLRVVHNQDALREAIDDKSALMAIDIGPKFTSDIERGRTAHIQLIFDGRDSNTAGLAMGYAQSIVTGFNQTETAQRKGGPPHYDIAEQGMVQPKP